MTKKRTAAISAGVAATAVAGGMLGRTLLNRRRAPHHHDLADLPPDDLGPIASFDGTKLAVRAAGDPANPTLVFVHGFSLDMTAWHEQWVELARDFRCVLVDQRAHGRSEGSKELSIDAAGRDLAAVLDSVAPNGKVVLVGHSMGAMAIFALADRHPELFGPRVAGVALIGAAASDLLHGAMGSVTELLRPRLGSLRTAARRVNRLRKAVLASPGDLSGAIARVTQFAPDAPQHLVDHVVALAGRSSSKVWTEGLAELMEMDVRHTLERITVPALVLVGEHDRVTPPAAAVELAGELPQGRLVVVERAGHMAMLERPREVNAELRTFAKQAFAGGKKKRRKRKAAAGGGEA